MKKILSLAIAVSGCASPPEPEVPSPYGRVPLNSDAAIQEYREQSTAEAALRRERTDLQRRLEATEQQLAEMKAYIIMQAAEKATPEPVRRATRSSAPAPERSPRATPKASDDQASAAPQGSLEVRTESVVFRVFQPYASSRFEPTPAMAEVMLKAANEGSSVVIRGRTDSNYTNDANQRIALARGVAARDFLIAHGVNESKIRVYFLSSGDFVADNKTVEGRAQNRRVEVETKGVNVAGYQNQKVI
jgi:outer membrane protein OmpA-like peptidoglycan-associated protein